MAGDPIDAYLAGVPEPHRTTLQALRKTIRAALPEAEEGLSYGMPAFKVGGKGVVAFAAFKNHCSYFPMSGGVLTALAADVAKYPTSKGALQFPVDKPLPATLVRKLVKARLAEIAAKKKR